MGTGSHYNLMCALLASALCARGLLAQTLEARAAFARETRVLSGLLDDPLRASLAELSEAQPVGLLVRGPEPARAALSLSLAASIERGGHRVTPLSDGVELPAIARAARSEVFVLASIAVNGTALSVELHVSELCGDPWRTFMATREPAPRELLSWSQATALSAATRASLGITFGPRWPGAPLGRPRTIATPFRSVLALGAADLDRDGRDELVLILPDRARAARFNGSSLVFLPDSTAVLSPLRTSPSPLRQPLATIAIDPTLGLVFRTSQQSLMGTLRVTNQQLSVSPVEALDTYPAAGFGCAALQPHTDSVRSLGPCTPGAALSPVSAPTAAVPVSITLTRPDGPLRVEAWPDLLGRVELRLRDGITDRVIRSVTVSGITAPLVLTDIDEDGDVELLGASASEHTAPDRLRVVTVRTSSLEERPSVSTPGPIEAITAADLDGDGLLDVALSVHDPVRHAATLWVLP